MKIFFHDRHQVHGEEFNITRKSYIKCLQDLEKERKMSDYGQNPLLDSFLEYKFYSQFFGDVISAKSRHQVDHCKQECSHLVFKTGKLDTKIHIPRSRKESVLEFMEAEKTVLSPDAETKKTKIDTERD